MRIAYVFTDLPDQAGIFPSAELEEMSRRGFEIEIFCLRQRLASGEGARRLREKFPVHSHAYLAPSALLATLSAFGRKPWWFIRSLFAAVGETLSNPRITIKTLAVIPKSCLLAREIKDGGFDLIHAYWASLPGRAAWWISGLTGIRYGTWAHAGADIYNRAHQTEPALKRILSGASLILTCNKRNLEYFSQILPREVHDRARYQPHGIDLERFAPEQSRSDTKTLIRPIRLLSVGNLVEPKGFHHAIEACRLLHERGVDFSYRIIGEGKDRGHLEALIGDLKGRIELAGTLPQDRLPDEYRSANLFLMPSVIGRGGGRDGLPNVLLEAMACGLPAIGTDAAGIPEAIEHEKTGLLVAPGDPTALASAIERLADDAPLRSRLIEAARKIVTKNYSRPACMDALARHFSSLIDETEHAGAETG